jgi:hypothetical protein
MNSLPPTGSLMEMPWLASQNDMASRKTPLCRESNCFVHRAPPLCVRKICTWPLSPGPALIAQARRALSAAMSRKSSRAAPATLSTVHVTPPLVVRAIRPCVPLAHTTVGLTAASPRNSAVVPLV